MRLVRVRVRRAGGERSVVRLCSLVPRGVVLELLLNVFVADSVQFLCCMLLSAKVSRMCSSVGSRSFRIYSFICRFQANYKH